MVEHDEVDTAILNELVKFDQVLERAAEAVELGDHQLIPAAVR